MNYTITFDKTTKDEPVLVVSRPEGWFGAPDIQVVKVFTGEEAVALWSLLTKDKTELQHKEGESK